MPLLAICMSFTLICACGSAPTLSSGPDREQVVSGDDHGASEEAAGSSLSHPVDTVLPNALIHLNLGAPAIQAPAALDSILSAEDGLPRAERLGRWARRFLASGETVYRFGLAEGGYVTEGLLVDDRHLDCVSLMYRCSELSAADDHLQALELALSTRFAGASLDSLIDAGGRVDYERPEHLDFSLDMIRSGLWGRDITPILEGAIPDQVGSSRYEPGSFVYLPGLALEEAELREGDVAWLVLSPEHEAARSLRDLHGLVVGHIGIIVMAEGESPLDEMPPGEIPMDVHGGSMKQADRRGARPWLIHAASSGLEGRYEGGRVEAVPLEVYLRRVERFCGVIITRF